MGNKFTELMNVRKLSCIALLLTVSLLSSASVKDTACIPVPAERQLKWHEAEIGVVFHYDLHVFDGQAYGQGSNRITPVEDYNIFAPEHVDTCGQGCRSPFRHTYGHSRDRFRSVAERCEPLLHEGGALEGRQGGHRGGLRGLVP